MKIKGMLKVKVIYLAWLKIDKLISDKNVMPLMKEMDYEIDFIFET